MSISPTSNLCPDCDKQTLDAISAPGGNWFACPQCGGILIPQDVILSLSEHREETQKTLDETKSFLLPTEKICPVCTKKLFDGRAWSRGIIFTLCSECHHFWTTLTTLGQLDAGVEYVVHGATEAPWAAALDQAAKPVEIKTDAGPGHFFRGIARVFDQFADRFSKKTTHTPVIPKYAQPQVPPASANTPASAGKPAPASAEMSASAGNPVPTPATSLPPTSLPFISSLPDNPQDWPPELLAEFQRITTEKFSTPAEPAPAAPSSVAKVEPPAPIPAPVTPAAVPAPVVKVETPAPTPTPVPPPVVKVEPPAPVPMPVPPPVTATPVSAPKEFKGFDYVAKRKGLIDKLKAAWANRPKPKPKPAPAPKPIPEPKPIPVPPVISKPVVKSAPVPAPVPVAKPAPISEPVKASATANPHGGFWASMKAAWNPQPTKKPASATPMPSQPVPKPVVVESPKPKVEPAPIPVVAAAPQTVVAAAPKPKKEKGPKEPFDVLLFWLPWGLLGLFVFLSSFREYGFENEPAILWGVMGWAMGMIVRAVMMYPFKSFAPATLSALSARTDIKGWRGVPVQLTGDVVLENDDQPKGNVVFEQSGERIALSRVTLWDILPRLFGLANPRQLLRGAVTLTGWYRRGLVPSIEVHEIRADKTTRKSLVKAMRIGLPVFLFVVAFVINLSLE